jgi:hypothetical protein
MIYIAATAVTFLPLLLAALLSPLSLTEVTGTLRLPFLYDWNVLFMFLISFPSLVVFIVNDQAVLSSSLYSVEIDGILTIAEVHASSLCTFWERRFRTINYIGQALGAITGALEAYVTYVAMTPSSVGFWMAENDRLLPVGFVFLYCLFLFYCLVPVLILRSVAVALLLRGIVARSHLRMLPMHPDKAGGLRPIGRLALRNQYLLTLFGLNIVLFVVVPFYFLQVPSVISRLIAVIITAYMILGPVVFMAPLLPFRNGMRSTKSELMVEIAQRLRVELQRLHAQLKSGLISKEDEELIDRLRKIGSVIDELPVWPFDAGTLRKFIAAYVIPVVSSLGIPIAKAVFAFAKGRFP